jgi:hypothetical protein
MYLPIQASDPWLWPIESILVPYGRWTGDRSRLALLGLNLQPSPLSAPLAINKPITAQETASPASAVSA